MVRAGMQDLNPDAEPVRAKAAGSAAAADKAGTKGELSDLEECASAPPAATSSRIHRVLNVRLSNALHAVNR